MYASGAYPTGSKGNDGLAVWIRADRPIENTDIVAKKDPSLEIIEHNCDGTLDYTPPKPK